MKNEQITQIKKKTSKFYLVGNVALSDKTFGLGIKSPGDQVFIYNKANIRFSCGDVSVYGSLMGGFSAKNPMPIRAHGFKYLPNSAVEVDDYEKQITVEFKDRKDPNKIKDIARSCFIRVGIELDNENKVVEKLFLSPYDAIDYLEKNLKDGTNVSVSGDYERRPGADGKVYTTKTIKTIFLSDAKPYNKFVQTILFSKDSFDRNRKPDENGLINFNAFAVDYLYKHEGIEIKKHVAYPFLLKFNTTKMPRYEEVIKKYFNADKNELIEMTIEGAIESVKPVVESELDELPDDVRELVDLGFYTAEQATARLAGASARYEEHNILVKPHFVKKDETLTVHKAIYKLTDLQTVGTVIANASSGDMFDKELNDTIEDLFG